MGAQANTWQAIEKKTKCVPRNGASATPLRLAFITKRKGSKKQNNT